MESIEKLWFADNRIHILTDAGNTYSRPLEAFPLLLDATPEQRAQYEIGLDGDDIHWDCIDEDIHISSFFLKEEPNADNPIADLFKRFPWLNISEAARITQYKQEPSVTIHLWYQETIRAEKQADI